MKHEIFHALDVDKEFFSASLGDSDFLVEQVGADVAFATSAFGTAGTFGTLGCLTGGTIGTFGSAGTYGTASFSPVPSF